MYKIIIFIFILAAFSCERKTAISDSGKVVVQIPHLSQISKAISNIMPLAHGPSPTSWSEVDCVGFMVSGPEPVLNQNACSVMNGRTGAALADIRFGPLHAGFYAGETAEFDVPAGSDRVLTAVGFKTNMTQANGAAVACKNMITQEKDSFSNAFVFATSSKFKVESGSTQTINLPINYVLDSTPFFGDCTGPTAPGSGGSSTPAGPPVRARVRLQDNLTSVTINSCVGVVVELLDANDRLANVTDDIRLTIAEAAVRPSMLTSIFFFLPDVTNRICDAGPIGGSATLDFFNGSVRFPQSVLFMKPIVGGGRRLNLTQDLGVGLPTVLSALDSMTLTIDNVTNPSGLAPYKVSIFDIKSFRSTATSSAANPIEVNNECRPGIVQILDNQGRPIGITNNGPGGGGDNIRADLNPALGSAAIVKLSADECSTMESNHFVEFAYNISSPTGLNVFSYQVEPATAGKRFGLDVVISGTGYYDSASPLVGLNSTSNGNFRSFWKVKNQ